MNRETTYRVLEIRKRLPKPMHRQGWLEIATVCSIDNPDWLLKQIKFGDAEYDASVLDVLRRLAENDGSALEGIEGWLDHHTFHTNAAKTNALKPSSGLFVDPQVFKVNDVPVDFDLVALMMPFDSSFDSVNTAIKEACKDANLKCQRVDDIWEDSTIIQDIFTLLRRAFIVVTDFSTRNPNVMYETGIAHTLGKHVVPISQTKADVPFDLQHHRFIQYLPNGEGLAKMKGQLTKRLKEIAEPF